MAWRGPRTNVVVGLLGVAACTDARTELVLGIATDLRATDQLDGVELVVKRADDGVVIVNTQFQISGQSGLPDNLPGSYGIYSDGDETRLDIEVIGTKAGAPMVSRRSVVGLVSGKTIFYRLGLTSACVSKTDCPANQTCAEGQCVGLRLNSNQFPAFAETIVDELTCAGGTAYLDTTTNAPMPMSTDAAQCPGNLCREGTCLTPPPACSASQATQGCLEAAAACNVGCMTTDCDFNFGDGTRGCALIPEKNFSSECLAALCALNECERSENAGWGPTGNGTCGLLGCDFEAQAFFLACVSDAADTPAVAPVAVGLASSGGVP